MNRNRNRNARLLLLRTEFGSGWLVFSKSLAAAALLLGCTLSQGNEFEPPDIIREPYTKPAPMPPPPAPHSPQRLAPQMLQNRPLSAPQYPQQSIGAGEQGVLNLWIFVDVDGKAAEIKVHQTSGFRLLDEAAVRKAESDWGFRPGSIDGEVTAQWVSV